MKAPDVEKFMEEVDEVSILVAVVALGGAAWILLVAAVTIAGKLWGPLP
jgi:hypothetical protein